MLQRPFVGRSWPGKAHTQRSLSLQAVSSILILQHLNIPYKLCICRYSPDCILPKPYPWLRAPVDSAGQLQTWLTGTLAQILAWLGSLQRVVGTR